MKCIHLCHSILKQDLNPNDTLTGVYERIVYESFRDQRKRQQWVNVISPHAEQRESVFLDGCSL